MTFGINDTIEFVPVKIAVLTVSDTRTEANDTSGDLLVERIEKAGHVWAEKIIIPDNPVAIAERIRKWADKKDIDVVITTGGTEFPTRLAV